MSSKPFVLVLLFLAGCMSEAGEYPPALNELLHGYAPSLTLGERASNPAQELDLECSPYVGYENPAFSARDGVRGLWVYAEDASDDGCAPWYARIEEVALGVPSPEVADAVESRVTDALGFAPEEACTISHMAFHFRVWLVEGFSVLMRTPLDPAEFEGGHPELIIGSRFSLDQLGDQEHVPCP